jgi:hypothetical protein
MNKKTKATPSAASKSVTRLVSPPAATPSEAQRMAATILEVLAGIGSPQEAAQIMSVSLPRYYQLEARALDGLVGALAPRPKGKQQSLENRIKVLEKQLELAQRQCARQQALVRVTQRALGTTLAMKPKPTSERDANGRKKRRPMVRAMKAAKVLKSLAAEHNDPTNTGNAEPASLQPVAPQPGVEEVQPCSA